MRTMWTVLLLITWAGVAHAGEEPAPKPPPPAPAAPVAPAPAATPPATPLTPEQAADRVLEGWKGKKPEVLKEIAALTDPDPWIVADELCARQEHDAAQAFARAAKSRDTEGLPAYLTQLKKTPTSAELRAAWREVAVDGKEKRYEEILRRVDALELGHSDVTSLLLRFERARSFRRLSRLPEARRAALDARQLAARVGWHAMARTLDLEKGRLDMFQGLEGMQRGEFDAGLAMVRVGADLMRTNGSREDVILANVVLGMRLVDSGLLAEAVRTLEGATGSAKPEVEAVRLLSLGTAYQNSGRRADALHAYEQVLEHPATDPPTRARVLGSSARILTATGEFSKAADLQRRAIEYFRDVGDRKSEAEGLVSWAANIQEMGTLESVEPILKRLHELAAEAPLGEQSDLLCTTADLERRLGRRDTSIETLERSVAAAREAGEERALAVALAALGGALDGTSRAAEAQRLLEEALPLVRRQADARALAVTLWRLGALLSERREFESAKRLLDEAIEVAQNSDDLMTASRALGTRAAMAVHEQDWRKVVACAREGEALLHRQSAGLATEAGARLRSGDIWVYTLGRMGALFLHSTPDLFHFAEASRAGALLEALGGRGDVDDAALSPDLSKAQRDLAVREAEAARALREARDTGERLAIHGRQLILKQVRGELLSLASSLERERKRAGKVVAPVLSSGDEIAKGLAEDQALVLYESLPTMGYWAVVVESTGIREVELGKGVDIPALIQAAAVDRSTPVDAAAIATLREFLVTRLQLPARVKRLIICPLDPLTFIPFMLLAPEMEISYAPSGTTFAWLAKERALRGQGVLALGDPRYGGTTQLKAAETRGGASRLSPLPATRAEVESVGTVVLLSDQATEKSLRTALARAPRWRAVHLAGHGLVDYREPSLSSIAVTPTGEDDGFLTLREVLGMKIPADLVVLSACETARGKEYQGEGVFGLTAAFMVAGAPRVLSSLWKVDDAATKALMVKFYELWNPKGGKPGLPTATALKQAQEFVASHEKWKHPYFWAAWVLWGDPS